MMTLVPGDYLLEFGANGSLQHYGYFLISGVDDSLDLSLDATFTPIPEPHWTPIVLGLIAIGCCVVGQPEKTRRRKAGQPSDSPRHPMKKATRRPLLTCLQLILLMRT